MKRRWKSGNNTIWQMRWTMVWMSGCRSFGLTPRKRYPVIIILTKVNRGYYLSQQMTLQETITLVWQPRMKVPTMQLKKLLMQEETGHSKVFTPLIQHDSIVDKIVPPKWCPPRSNPVFSLLRRLRFTDRWATINLIFWHLQNTNTTSSTW